MAARRIAVLGPMGSGKTTLAARLAHILRVPHVEMDALFWQEGWRETPTEAFRAQVAARAADEAWVIDGDYLTRTGGLVLERAEAILWLDYALPVLVWRLVRRTLRRVISRQVLWNGNREDLRALVGADSTLVWLLRGYSRRRSRLAERLLSAQVAPRVVRFHTPRDTERWVKRIAVVGGNEKAPSASEGA